MNIGELVIYDFIISARILEKIMFCFVATRQWLDARSFLQNKLLFILGVIAISSNNIHQFV